MVLDILPSNPKVLGFSNSWYSEALKTAQAVILEPALVILLVAAPVFLATKLEAFKSRGKGDPPWQS